MLHQHAQLFSNARHLLLGFTLVLAFPSHGSVCSSLSSLFAIHTKILSHELAPLTTCLLVSSANNVCKQFGPRLGPTQRRA